jgi:hypothetical protein
MPITPLFPADNEPVTIKQGEVGDCYLLAGLDCIINVDPEGRAKFKSMFTQTADGVTVRIKRTAIGNNLKLKMLTGKYRHSYNRNQRVDEFFISNSRLKLIDDENSIGVKSNSLAVKIIEHISSYYYTKSWDHREAYSSLKAHIETGERFKVSDNAFVAQLLGVETQISSMDDIVKLKQLSPDFPAYIAIAWNAQSAHIRHALRIRNITVKRGITYFELVNPWDNTKTETYSLFQIKDRNPFFAVFAPTIQKLEKGNLLIRLPKADGRYLQSKPELSILIQKIKKNMIIFNKHDAQRLIKLYREMPGIVTLYGKLTKMEQQEFHSCVFQSKGEKNAFINEFLKRINRIEVVREVVSAGLPAESCGKIIDLCLLSKDAKLFGLIQNLDLFSHLMFSQLDNEQFLQHLIGLESEASLPDSKRLKIIDEYIKAYNAANTSTPLQVQVPHALIADVVFTQNEAKIVQAKITVLFAMDAIKNYRIDFTTANTTVEIAALRHQYIEYIKTFHSDDIAAALSFLDPKESEKVQIFINNKIAAVNSAADQLINKDKLEKILAKFEKDIDLFITFARDVDEHVIRYMEGMYKDELKRIASDPELLKALADLGLESHPTIAKAMERKTVEIETSAQTRSLEIKQYREVIAKGIRSFEEFSSVLPEAQSANDVSVALTRQIQTLDTLLNAPELRDAHQQLGLIADNMGLMKAYKNKRKAIEADAEKQLRRIAAAENRVQDYLHKISEVSVSLANVDNEIAVRNCTSDSIEKLLRLREQIHGDKELESKKVIKKDLLAAITTRERAIFAEGVIAHNRILYTQLERALEQSGFNEARDQVTAISERAQTMTKRNSINRLTANASLVLQQTINTAKNELMTMPNHVKLSSIKAEHKLDAFKRTVLTAISQAKMTLNSNSWARNLSALEASAALLGENFPALAKSTPVVHHSIFASPTKMPISRNKTTDLQERWF